MPISFAKINELGLSQKAIDIAKRYGGKPLGEFLDRAEFEELGVKIPKAKFFEAGILTEPDGKEPDDRKEKWRQRGVDLSGVDFSKSLLARACVMADEKTGHAGDFGQGTVMDFIATEKVKSETEFFDYLDRLATLCKDGKHPDGNVRDYYQYEGGDPNRLAANVGVLLAQKEGHLVGSMVEHPGEKGVYLIEYVEGYVQRGVFRETDDGDIETVRSMSRESLKKERVKSLIQAYKKIREKDLIPDDRSFHMEFSFDCVDKALNLNQIKLFRKKYKASEDFQLKTYSGRLSDRTDFTNSDQATSVDYSVFGITPKEGIELTLYPITRNANDENYVNVDGENGYAYEDRSSTRHLHKRPHMSFMPKGQMKLGVFRGSNTGCLMHGGHWMLANSDIGLWQDMIPCSKEGPVEVRVISDGVRARVEKLPALTKTTEERTVESERRLVV